MGSTGSQAGENEEIHFYRSRHEHELVLREGLEPYTCSGCKQYGANSGYKCHSCADLVLHQACASLPDEYVHPLHKQHQLKFRAKTLLRHHCNACGDVLRGFVFESHHAHLRLHPLCMALPVIVNYGGHKCHSLKLVVEKGRKFNCGECKQENSNWRYRCEETACGLNLDMSCVKVDFHGLSEHGISRAARSSSSSSKHLKELLSKSGRYVAGVVVEGTVSGMISAAFD